MQLIINCPTDNNGIKEFNCVFSKVQKELLLYCIRSLNIDILSKEKILNNIAKELKKQAYEKEGLNEL